jgi:hypothetical protein
MGDVHAVVAAVHHNGLRDIDRWEHIPNNDMRIPKSRR